MANPYEGKCVWGHMGMSKSVIHLPDELDRVLLMAEAAAGMRPRATIAKDGTRGASLLPSIYGGELDFLSPVATERCPFCGATALVEQRCEHCGAYPADRRGLRATQRGSDTHRKGG